MDALAQRYSEVHVVGGAVEEALSLGPLGERAILGGKALIFEDADRERPGGTGPDTYPFIG